jgi:L-rhamnose mutarotase
MANFSFKMQLKLGHETEYQRRHEAIWPELLELLKNAGISDYSIYLDGPTGTLFACLTRVTNHTMDQLPLEPLMQRWWNYMADIMETGLDNEPIVVPLDLVFYMP